MLGDSMLINSTRKWVCIALVVILLIVPITTPFISSKTSLQTINEENEKIHTISKKPVSCKALEISNDSLIKFERVNIGCFIWGKGRAMYNKLYLFILDELSSKLHKKYPKIAKLLSKIVDKLSEIDAKIPVTISLLAGFCGGSMRVQVIGLLGTWNLCGGVSITMIGFTGIWTEDFILGYAPFVGLEMYDPHST